jgi:hypothetical protein
MSKRILCAAGILVCAIPTFASVAPVCENGTLQDYVNLGSTGCSDGTVLFSNFAIEPVPQGAMPLDPSTFQLVPITYLLGSGPPGLGVFQTQITAGPNETWDLLLHFDAIPISGASVINSASAGIIGFAFSNSTYSAALDLCAGGSFADGTPTGCSGNFASAEAFVSPTLSLLSDSTSFPGAGSADAFFDFREVSGPQVSSLSFDAQFTVSTAPEPATIPLVAVGLGAMVLYRERRRLRSARR